MSASSEGGLQLHSSEGAGPAPPEVLNSSAREEACFQIYQQNQVLIFTWETFSDLEDLLKIKGKVKLAYTFYIFIF